MLSSIRRSLSDLTGISYADALVQAASFLHGWPVEHARSVANEPVEFFSSSRVQRINDLTSQIGQKVTDPLPHPLTGAPTDAFARASQLAAAPLGGLGPYRLGEDGRLYLAAKSEHYQLSVGHQFEGYQMIDRARHLGVVNATHNNTRGSITRKLERELVRTVNGIKPEDDVSLKTVLELRESKVLNRVINLETGSLAVEAGVKMMLARFYRLEPQLPTPAHAGKIPVFLVLADHAGGLTANYHGTTLITQVFRGLWPELGEKAEKARFFQVVPVRINDLADFAAKIAFYNQGDYRTAGFLHEIILMNYGGIRLEPAFLKGAYALCAASETPTLVDEIQSCMWYPGMY
ncbi:MAG: aminotransferase class III-fold pyridoxal phosphate-dependent enzyme, partial [Clostridia bacterium]|nr:aminotransferase class III-fold pyridoxal phosphate-dependent enzyme [Clostridia bacterium]